jgi:TPR repeat protein
MALVAASTASAQDKDSPLALCDRLAASTFDSTRPAGIEGVPPHKIDAKAAVPACEAALEAAPGSSRIMFQLGRAYNRAGMHAKAREQYARADALGHVLATNNLGAYFFDGQGGPRDLSEARRLYEKAAAGGVAIAMSNLGSLYENGLAR